MNENYDDTHVTFQRDWFLIFVNNMLSDENGVSKTVYADLYNLIIRSGHLELWKAISDKVEATDDRFYLPLRSFNLEDKDLTNQ